MANHFVKYDPEANDVTLAEGISWETLFKEEPTNLFAVSFSDAGITVMDEQGQTLHVKDVNSTQAVILFHAMLGLKEAARE